MFIDREVCWWKIQMYTLWKSGKKDLSHLKNHIETHLEGLSFPCQLCEKTFRSRNALSIHKTRYHK